MVARGRAAAVTTAGVVGSATASRSARAHVKYVTQESGTPEEAVRFAVRVLSEPLNAALFLGGGVVAVVAVAAYLRFGSRVEDLRVLREALYGYADLVPWMLRLSLGLPTVGAGFAGYFFSPVVPTDLRLFQVAVGFLLLFGLATRFVAAVGLAAYLAGLVVRPELFLASEYVGGFVALVLLGSGRPSADHLLQRVADAESTVYGRFDPVHEVATRFNRLVDPYEAYAATAVRVSLGVNFVYLGLVEKLLAPNRALQVVEKYDLTAVVPVDPGVWVLGAGLTEMAVGLALVVGLLTRGVAGVAFLLFTTTLFGLPDDPVLAHVTLFGMASVLLVTGSGPVAVDRWLRDREWAGRPTTEAAAGT